MQGWYPRENVSAIITKYGETNLWVKGALRSMDATRHGGCRDCGRPLNPRYVVSTAQARWCPECAHKHKVLDAGDTATLSSAAQNDRVSEGDAPRPAPEDKRGRRSRGYVPYTPLYDLGSLRRWWRDLPRTEQEELWRELTVPRWMADCSGTRFLAHAIMQSRGHDPSVVSPGLPWLQIAHEYWATCRNVPGPPES